MFRKFYVCAKQFLCPAAVSQYFLQKANIIYLCNTNRNVLQGCGTLAPPALVPSFQQRGSRTCSSIVFHPSRQQMPVAIIWPLMSLIIKVLSVINNLSIIALWNAGKKKSSKAEVQILEARLKHTGKNRHFETVGWMELSILEIDFLKIRIKARPVCRECTQALLDYPCKTLTPVFYRRTTGGAERLPTANVGVCVLTSDLGHCGMLQLYGSLQLYSFQWVYTCASCSLFIGTAVYSEGSEIICLD